MKKDKKNKKQLDKFYSKKMEPNNRTCNSACRHCQFYHPEGRRGGLCSQLGVSVKATWKSCNFALPAFETQWQPLPEVVMLEKSFSLGCATPKVNPTTVESNPVQSKEILISADEVLF